MTTRTHVTSAPCEGTLQLHNINMACLILKGHISIEDNPWPNHLPPTVRK